MEKRSMDEHRAFLWHYFKKVMIANVLSLLVYMATAWLASALVYMDDKSEIRNPIPMYVYMSVVYALVYHFTNRLRKKELEQDIDFTKPFSIKEDLSSYWIDEAKYLLIIYGVFGVFLEVTRLILGPNAPNPYSLLCAMPMALYWTISWPVVRCIVSVALNFILAIIFRVLQYFRYKREYFKVK